jgi:CheY-like chemotaxis protein
LRDGKVYTREELQEFRLNSYRLNPLTDFQSNSKACLLDFLRARGYNVEESPRVKGRSGAVHSLDILASRDDIIVQHHVGIGIFAAKAGETEVPIDELLNFQAKAADIGIRNLVVVAIPKLSPQAQSLAETQQIKVLTIDDIADLSSSQTRSSPETETANAGEVRPEVTGKATAPLTAEVTGPADQRKVLWIDKDVASSVEFARVLKIAGFEVMVFEDPDEGIQKVNEASLVVIDDELSNAGMLFSRIRNQAAVPIIVISSREGKDVRVTDDSGTADAYFKRTISGRELVARIRSVLRHQ